MFDCFYQSQIIYGQKISLKTGVIFHHNKIQHPHCWPFDDEKVPVLLASGPGLSWTFYGHKTFQSRASSPFFVLTWLLVFIRPPPACYFWYVWLFRSKSVSILQNNRVGYLGPWYWLSLPWSNLAASHQPHNRHLCWLTIHSQYSLSCCDLQVIIWSKSMAVHIGTLFLCDHPIEDWSSLSRHSN